VVEPQGPFKTKLNTIAYLPKANQDEILGIKNWPRTIRFMILAVESILYIRAKRTLSSKQSPFSGNNRTFFLQFPQIIPIVFLLVINVWSLHFVGDRTVSSFYLSFISLDSEIKITTTLLPKSLDDD